MTVSITDVLEKADTVVGVFEARLNNTEFSEFGYEDHSAGMIPFTSIDLDIVSGNNSQVRISNGQALNSGASDVMSSRLMHSRSIGQNFAGAATQSITDIQFAFEHGNDQLQFRDLSNRKFTYKIGGIIDGDEMVFDDYPLSLIHI